jgi:hypothetical protein
MTEERTEIDVTTAHRINKEYKHNAGQTLLNVRITQW